MAPEETRKTKRLGTTIYSLSQELENDINEKSKIKLNSKAYIFSSPRKDENDDHKHNIQSKSSAKENKAHATDIELNVGDVCLITLNDTG